MATTPGYSPRVGPYSHRCDSYSPLFEQFSPFSGSQIPVTVRLGAVFPVKTVQKGAESEECA